MGAVSTRRHKAGVCVTPLMTYLCSGLPEWYSPFHIKTLFTQIGSGPGLTNRLSSLRTRIVPGVTLSREGVRDVCAQSLSARVQLSVPLFPAGGDCAGWFMSLHVSILACYLGEWPDNAGGLWSGLRGSIHAKCLTRCMMSAAILTPNIGHGRKRLFAM